MRCAIKHPRIDGGACSTQTQLIGLREAALHYTPCRPARGKEASHSTPGQSRSQPSSKAPDKYPPLARAPTPRDVESGGMTVARQGREKGAKISPVRSQWLRPAPPSSLRLRDQSALFTRRSSKAKLLFRRQKVVCAPRWNARDTRGVRSWCSTRNTGGTVVGKKRFLFFFFRKFLLLSRAPKVCLKCTRTKFHPPDL